MTQVIRGFINRNRRKNKIWWTFGAISSNSQLYQMSQQDIITSLRYAYRSSCEQDRHYRSAWLVRLNVRAHIYGRNYSRLIHNLQQNIHLLNRKILAQTITHDPSNFQTLTREFL